MFFNSPWVYLKIRVLGIASGSIIARTVRTIPISTPIVFSNSIICAVVSDNNYDSIELHRKPSKTNYIKKKI